LALDPFRVKRALVRADITLRQIAQKAGVQSVAQVSDVLAGRKRSLPIEQAVQELLRHGA